jgi:hypothetical protein
MQFVIETIFGKVSEKKSVRENLAAVYLASLEYDSRALNHLITSIDEFVKKTQFGKVEGEIFCNISRFSVFLAMHNDFLVIPIKKALQTMLNEGIVDVRKSELKLSANEKMIFVDFSFKRFDAEKF